MYTQDSLVEALASGDPLRIVTNCCRLEAVREPSSSSKKCGTPTPSFPTRSRRGCSRFRNVSQWHSTNIVHRNRVEGCFASFWEAEVLDAWRRQDAQDLAWALELAVEAGVEVSRLDGPRLALKDLAERELNSALEQGDHMVCSSALRTAEMLGVNEVLLSEARLIIAERTGDPFLILQEVAAIRRCGHLISRLDEVSARAEAAKLMETCSVMRDMSPIRGAFALNTDDEDDSPVDKAISTCSSDVATASTKTCSTPRPCTSASTPSLSRLSSFSNCETEP